MELTREVWLAHIPLAIALTAFVAVVDAAVFAYVIRRLRRAPLGGSRDPLAGSRARLGGSRAPLGGSKDRT